MFRSASLTKALHGAKVSDKDAIEKLAAAEKTIASLNDQLRHLQSKVGEPVGGGDETRFVGRFKRLYKEHVQSYHPDKLSGRSEMDRKVGEEVTRILNHLYQALKV